MWARLPAGATDERAAAFRITAGATDERGQTGLAYIILRLSQTAKRYNKNKIKPKKQSKTI